jgi:uncharacterized protein (TIGR00304 family)
MRRWRGLGLALLVGAVAALAWGGLQGDLQVALVLVFPVVYGSGPWAALGILLAMASFAAFAADAFSSLPRPPEGSRRRGGDGGGEPRRADPGRDARGAETGSVPWEEDDGSDGSGGGFRGGGVVMLGPIPIVLGSDKRSTMILLGLAVLLMAMGLAWVVLGGS